MKFNYLNLRIITYKSISMKRNNKNYYRRREKCTKTKFPRVGSNEICFIMLFPIYVASFFFYGGIEKIQQMGDRYEKSLKERLQYV